MIRDDECALWRQVDAGVAGAFEVYLDLLLTRDPARARHLRSRIKGKPRYPKKEAATWIEVLGLDGCESLELDPLPRELTIDADHIDCLEPVLSQLPFLQIHLVFDNAHVTEVFPKPAAARIRRLSFRAHRDSIDPEESGVALMREHFDDLVLSLLCKSPNMAQLERLWVFQSNEIGPASATKIAAGPFVGLRELWISGQRIDDAGAIALASAPFAAGLRRLDLGGNQIGDAGARALAALDLEKLDLSRNQLTPQVIQELRALPHVTV